MFERDNFGRHGELYSKVWGESSTERSSKVDQKVEASQGIVESEEEVHWSLFGEEEDAARMAFRVHKDIKEREKRKGWNVEVLVLCMKISMWRLVALALERVLTLSSLYWAEIRISPFVISLKFKYELTCWSFFINSCVTTWNKRDKQSQRERISISSKPKNN